MVLVCLPSNFVISNSFNLRKSAFLKRIFQGLGKNDQFPAKLEAISLNFRGVSPGFLPFSRFLPCSVYISIVLYVKLLVLITCCWV